MNTLRHTRRIAAVAALATLPSLGLATTAFAAHESSNKLDFDAVTAGSAVDGAGTINYVKGASGDSEDTSVWQQSLRFTGLTAGTYTVIVKRGAGDGRVVPGSDDRTICTFTATATGTGSCTGRFLELRALAVAQLKSGSTVVAQATRTGAPNALTGMPFPTSAPGEITSDGGCREPGAGSGCVAPGQL